MSKIERVTDPAPPALWVVEVDDGLFSAVAYDTGWRGRVTDDRSKARVFESHRAGEEWAVRMGYPDARVVPY